MALYAYGLVRSDPAPAGDVRGIDGEAVTAIGVGPLAALVSDVGEERELDVDDAAAHVAVLDAVFAARPVLPFRFGIVAADEESIRSYLAPRTGVYAAHLDRLSGRVELEVRAQYEEQPTLARILAEAPGLRELSRTVGEKATLEERLELGEWVAGELEARKPVDARNLDQHLAPIATAVAAMDPGEGVLRAAYLVAASRQDGFLAAARTAAEQAPWLYLDIIGPRPPYSFADPPELSEDESQTWMEEQEWTSC